VYVTALNTNDARNRNLAAVFDAIRDRAGASRKEIGVDMPFSLQTMTNVVQELIEIGLVEEVVDESAVKIGGGAPAVCGGRLLARATGHGGAALQHA
jgi:hypothetical protein